MTSRFACTSPACSFECGYARGLHKRGHEIATHTVTHAGLRWFERDGIEEEIGGARDDIVKCGIPAEDVVGFRTPYLADKPEVRETLYEDGFRCGGGGGRALRKRIALRELA